MKKYTFTTVLLICLGLMFVLSSCNKEIYADYIVEGRIVNKNTKEPVKNIMVDFHKYDIIHSPSNKHKYSPIKSEDWSDENGKFRSSVRVLVESSPSMLYIYGSYGDDGLYKDTTVSIDFSTVTLSGKPARNYKGEYILLVGDIELEKIN